MKIGLEASTVVATGREPKLDGNAVMEGRFVRPSMLLHGWSGRGNSSPVGRNNLRLKSKYFAAVSIHQYLHPMDIIGAVCLVVAKGLDSRKVFQPAYLGIEERFVNPEIVRVSVNIGDWLLEGNEHSA